MVFKRTHLGKWSKFSHYIKKNSNTNKQNSSSIHNNINEYHKHKIDQKKPQDKIHTIWFHLYEVQKWAKWIYDRGKNSSYCCGKWGMTIDWKGTQENFLGHWKCSISGSGWWSHVCVYTQKFVRFVHIPICQLSVIAYFLKREH